MTGSCVDVTAMHPRLPDHRMAAGVEDGVDNDFATLESVYEQIREPPKQNAPYARANRRIPFGAGADAPAQTLQFLAKALGKRGLMLL